MVTHMNGEHIASVERSLEEERLWFEERVKECETNLFRFAYCLTGNADRAKDLVQEALLRAFQYRHSFDSRYPFENWVAAILLNIHRQRERRDRFLKFFSALWQGNGEEDEEDFVEQLEYEGEGPEAIALKRQVIRDVYRAIEDLPGKMREVMVLCDIMGYSYEEASEIIGCPIGTIRSRLHRARRYVKKVLEAVYGDELLRLWG
ncbi:RNA polymerase sigma factor [Candidatus Caldatribacterium sp.]|uniref:RNA polymerase sigma factor n=1 Tax=Candidatus Caldatribacterium sp. TaxID=2282143 RepID=UPI003872BBE6